MNLELVLSLKRTSGVRAVSYEPRHQGVKLDNALRQGTHPLFQNVPNEKQTAEPPVITKDDPVFAALTPISSGRGVSGRSLGNTDERVQSSRSKMRISSARLSN